METFGCNTSTRSKARGLRVAARSQADLYATLRFNNFRITNLHFTSGAFRREPNALPLIYPGNHRSDLISF